MKLRIYYIMILSTCLITLNCLSGCITNENNTNNINHDSDKDGLTDYEEQFKYKTNYLKLDSDNDGFYSTLTQIIHVNYLPVPEYKYKPTNPTAGQSIEFDARESFDPDGYITEYYWSYYPIVSGPPIIPLPIGYGKHISYSLSLPGDYNVTLKVTDNNGVISFLTKTITVFPSNECQFEDTIQ